MVVGPGLVGSGEDDSTIFISFLSWLSPLEQTWTSFTQRCIVLSLVKVSPMVLEETIFKFRQCSFAILLPHLPLEIGKILHLNKVESLLLKGEIDWNLSSGSGEELILSMFFRNFVIISHKKRRCPAFEETWIDFTQGCFVPTLVEIGSVDLKKIFINFVNAFFIFLLSLPGKEQSPSFEQTYYTPRNELRRV